ncbi:TetR/AcrR family transcriptional regulator [Phenylobacterium sp.]|uniref:TetR/AcrR family transcriptional regulator n=1 Tax=Phenylobacterium sp. TaxID=1871053 RepID=UPI002F951A72
MARGYEQKKRGEAAEETRRRIVQATFELHCEQGVAATTMKQIAERAGVSVGSVYHHFPTYDDAIQACGAHAFSLAPSPEQDLFGGIPDRGERVRRLAQALFGFYARVRGLAYVIAEQDRMPVLKAFADQERQVRARLAGAAVGDEGGAKVVAALLDYRTYDALRDQGFDPDSAAARAAEVANAWLDQPPERKDPH